MSKPRLTKLLNDIEILRKRNGITVKQVAAGIGKPDNENQVYNWLVERSHEPKGEIVLALQEWYNAESAPNSKSATNKTNNKKETSHAS